MANLLEHMMSMAMSIRNAMSAVQKPMMIIRTHFVTSLTCSCDSVMPRLYASST